MRPRDHGAAGEPASPPGDATRRAAPPALTATALLLTVLAVALHWLHWRQGGALWRDEAGPVQLATLPTWGEVAERFPHEAFPLLFMGLVRGFVELCGQGDLALRALGGAIGVGLLAALWVNARLAGALPLASLALVAFHPGLILYGDSLRGYGLGALLVVLAGAAYQRHVERPGWRSFLLAALAATASVHTVLHDSALVAGLAVAAAATLALERRLLAAAGALASAAAAALSLLPYAGPLRAAREWSVVTESPDLGAGAIFGAAAAVLSTPSPAMLAAWLAMTALAAVAAWQRRESGLPDAPTPRLAAARFRWLALASCAAAQYGFFVAVGYVPSPWYFLPLMALWASSLDVLLAVPGRRRGTRPALAAAALLLVAAQLPGALASARARMTNVDEVARLLGAQAAPHDLVVVNPWYLGVSFHRYYRGAAPWTTLPRLADHRFHRNDQLKQRMAATAPIADVLADVRATLASGGRVWLVGSFEPPASGEPLRLAPAPAGGFGWANAPYCISWSQQLAEQLRRRAGRGRVVISPQGAVNPFEALGVRVFRRGVWRPRARSGPT